MSVNGDTAKKAKQAKNGAWGLESVDSHTITYVHIIVCISVFEFYVLSMLTTAADIHYDQSRTTMDTDDWRDGFARSLLAYY